MAAREQTERLVAAIEAAAQKESDWEAQLSVGLRAGLELLAADPALACLLLVDSLATPGRPEYERSLARLAEALRPPAELTGRRPISDEILRLQAHGLVSYASGRVLDGEAESLPEAHEALLAFLLAQLPPKG
jgi:hypothetical protein